MRGQDQGGSTAFRLTPRAPPQVREWERENNCVRPLPIISVSANFSDTDKEKYSCAGMDGVLGKPVSTRGLPVWLKQFFKQYQQHPPPAIPRRAPEGPLQDSYGDIEVFPPHHLNRRDSPENSKDNRS